MVGLQTIKSGKLLICSLILYSISSGQSLQPNHSYQFIKTFEKTDYPDSIPGSKYDLIATTPGSHFSINYSDSTITILDEKETNYKIFVYDSFMNAEGIFYNFYCNIGKGTPPAAISIILLTDKSKLGHMGVIAWGRKKLVYEFKRE